MVERFEGGCLCGAVRYAAEGTPVAVALCHCEVCRRASGAPVVAWALFPHDGFLWTRGEASSYASSEAVVRTFCNQCGTQLVAIAETLPGITGVTVGSLDEAERLPPQFHIFASHALSWLELADELPRHGEFPPEG